MDDDRPFSWFPMRFPTPRLRFDEAVETAKFTHSIALIVWDDDRQREAAMRELAEREHAILHTCGTYTRIEQLYLGLAVSAGITPQKSFKQNHDLVNKCIIERQAPVLIDRADQLSTRLLLCLRDLLNDHDDHAPYMVIAGQTEILRQRADDSDSGGQFRSRCGSSINCTAPDDAPTPRIRKRHKQSTKSYPRLVDT